MAISKVRAALAGIVGLAVAALAPVSLAASAPTASERQFAATYVAALQSNNRNELTAIYHPATLACMNADTQPYFDAVLDQALRRGPDMGPHYRLMSFKPPAGAPFMADSDLFTYPIAPTHEMQIDSRSGDDRAVKIVSLIVYLAPANGTWGVVLPCPTAKGMQVIRQQLASRQR